MATATFEEPDLSPEDGWTEIQLAQRLAGCRSFVSDDPEQDRLRVRYFCRDTDEAIVGRAWFGPGAEGPPGHAHGGSLAAVLDEALGAAVWAAGHAVLTGELTVKYLRAMPLGTVATIETWLSSVNGRKVVAGGHLIGDSGVIHCRAESTFVKLNPKTFTNQKERMVELIKHGRANLRSQ